MNQILIGQKVAYAAKNGGGVISALKEVGLLATGALAVFTKSGKLLDNDSNLNTYLTDEKEIIIAVGNQSNDKSLTMITVPIPRVGTNYSKKAYVAPVLQKKFVGDDGTQSGAGLNLPTTIVYGDVASIKVIDTTLGLRTIGIDTKRYEIRLVSTLNDVELVASLVAAINADPDSIVTAAAVDTDDAISLEHKTAGGTFSVSLGGILENATICEVENGLSNAAVAPTYGEGTYDLVKALEDAYSVNRGNTNQVYQSQSWFNTTSLAVSGYTYNVYTYQWGSTKVDSLGIKNAYLPEIKVAIPSSGTAPTTTFNAIMVAVFGQAYGNAKVESGS